MKSDALIFWTTPKVLRTLKLSQAPATMVVIAGSPQRRNQARANGREVTRIESISAISIRPYTSAS